MLFDIDGTLIRGAGAGRRALEEVFEARYGRPDVLARVVFHGATDRAILRQALADLDDAEPSGALTDASTDALIDAVIAHYVEVLPRWIARSGYVAHGGVEALLERLAASASRELALGLGTGNVEAAARLKLEPAGLNRYFDFGGFGSDAEDRAELLEIGARRGASRLALSRQRCRVVVVGDTVRDVTAAHAIGASCVAVATGGSSAEQLGAAGAELVVATLEDAAVGAYFAAL